MTDSPKLVDSHAAVIGSPSGMDYLKSGCSQKLDIGALAVTVESYSVFYYSYSVT